MRLAGRLADGRSFAAIIRSAERPRFVSDPAGDWERFEGGRLRALPTAERPAAGVFESGFNAAEEYLLFRGIRGTVSITGATMPGQRVDVVFVDPLVYAAEHRPRVMWAALDTETDRAERVVALSLVCVEREAVFFLPDSHSTAGALGGGAEALEDQSIHVCRSERELLESFAATLRDWDPDIIAGWNVTAFDFTVLARRFEALGIRFDIGRAEDEPAQVRTTASGLRRVVVPGRQVVDAMRIVRGSGRSFADLRLETVAQAVLGRGKVVETVGTLKVEELERLRREEPLRFCRYCLEDSRLVLEILAETGLDTLTLARANLTGMRLDLAWTSIPAFERIYALELLKRRVLPPAAPQNRDVSGAAGGTVLDPVPGYFHHVLVFDFRSLYPSIIRTFNIDPLGFERVAQEPDPTGPSECIVAPNGARFSRVPGILPTLIDTYFAARQAAIGADDTVGAYVYKILMNSFYGVLGSSGCRYARSELAGAITSFGKFCLLFARDFFVAQGLTVLYGDTDSVFVYAGGQDLGARGHALAVELNAGLAQRIHELHAVESMIRIRCDVVYTRFLLPRLRAAAADAADEIRGRAKGYAGSVVTPPGGSQSTEESSAPRIEIKGMEAARSDYTPLARRFQRELLALLFADSDAATIDRYVRGIVSALLEGTLDAELVYSKVLRRPAEQYHHAAPPQVRAARALGWTTQKGRVDYLITTAGPEPVTARNAPIDYAHYIDHQLRPIWESVAEAVDLADSLVQPTPAQPHADGPLPNVAGHPKPATPELTRLRPLDDQLELRF